MAPYIPPTYSIVYIRPRTPLLGESDIRPDTKDDEPTENVRNIYDSW